MNFSIKELDIIAENWGINNLPGKDSLSEEDVLNILLKAISGMLEESPEELAQLFYRLDVKEEKFKAAFAQSNPEKVALKLAEAALEREKERLFWRRKYASGGNSTK